MLRKSIMVQTHMLEPQVKDDVKKLFWFYIIANATLSGRKHLGCAPAGG